MTDSFHKADVVHVAPGVHLHPGDVIRLNSWGAFGDCVILGFNEQGEARVSRPYAYATGIGTTGPTLLQGAETFNLPVALIVSHYKVIENDGHRIVGPQASDITGAAV
jgi:hypothetical protein